MERGLVLALREVCGADVGDVFARLAGVYGVGAIVGHSMGLSDELVEAVATRGTSAEIALAAANPRLTAGQLCRLIEAGGDPVVAAAFAPKEQAAPAVDAAEAADAVEVGAEGGGEADALDRGRAVLRSPGVGADEAIRLIRAHPVLAHTARWAGGTGVLHAPELPVTRVEALDQVGPALRAGVLTPAEILARMRPARVALQVLAVAAREHAYVTGTTAIHELLRPAIVATVGVDPAAWAYFARELPRFAGSLPELLADAVAHGADEGGRGRGATRKPLIRVPSAVRPSVVFLLRRLDAEELIVLLPHLDAGAVVALLPGGVPPLANVAEAAFRSGHATLLEALAEHQQLGRDYAARLKDLGDDRIDRALVANRSGVTAELRREIYAGRRAGRPRSPMDPDLRIQLLNEPPYGGEHTAFTLSGDPALVHYALPRCDPKRLRRIDWIDIVLSLWERADPLVTGDILANHRDLFPERIATTAEAALAADDPTPLRELRARWDRGPRAVPPVPEHRRPAAERVRETPLEGWYSWLVGAVTSGELDASEIVLHARPARHAFAASVAVEAYHWAPSTARPAFADLAKRIGPNPEAWVILANLTADFEGTLVELADLAAAAAG
ncbi:hypothetical protein [Embleya sp. NBC_00896]|uniref:hypothetical protein n=1 Tax=Embleya sp. NBC_00896 TaxID=2975961 RepID=UPI00386B2585|nr:hypothetical protein OG928_11035 [Embleya sp. NBC_00896]